MMFIKKRKEKSYGADYDHGEGNMRKERYFPLNLKEQKGGFIELH